MKLKTYVARDPQEALAQVKKELGPEAVILSTQSRGLPSSGSRSPGRRRVEVTAAADQAVDLDAMTDFEPWFPDPVKSRWFSMDLREELEEMKTLLKQWLGDHGPPPWLAPYHDLTLIFQDLTRAGVHYQIMGRWLGKVRNLLEIGKDDNPKNLKELCLRQLMQEIEVVDPMEIPGKKPLKWTFLGATGVGKTTTIAKLAIQAAFMKKIRVGLISLDTVRLGGHEHLAAYARISGLPFIPVQTQGELNEALGKMADLDLILIDTPGRNPRDSGLPLDLRRLFGELPELEHHLVVGATTTEANLADAFQGFRVIPLASCIVTKVDEARDIVGVFNQLYKERLPISYLTTGQKVPEDLKLATYRLLAKHLFNLKVSRGFPGKER
jgi:flagellar biosynthesis protein FlhF